MYNTYETNGTFRPLSLKRMSEDYQQVLRYLVRRSDSFSLVMHMIRPYTQNPNLCQETAFSQVLEPYLVRQVLNAWEWPCTKTNEKHLALNYYRCPREVAFLLTDLPCLFRWEYGVIPQDLCFYRDGGCWFSTVSHEEFAFILNPCKEDLDRMRPCFGSDKPVFICFRRTFFRYKSFKACNCAGPFLFSSRVQAHAAARGTSAFRGQGRRKPRTGRGVCRRRPPRHIEPLSKAMDSSRNKTAAFPVI